MNLLGDDSEEERFCSWNGLFNNAEKNALRNGYVIIGLLSFVPCIILIWVLTKSPLNKNRSYRNLAHFIIVSAVLRLFQFLTNVGSYDLVKEFLCLMPYKVELIVCDLFGFIEAFLTVLETELLTHMCVERYVLAKYTTKGKVIPDSHYQLYLHLSYSFACVYTLPVFGFGRYSWDFTCETCGYDMKLPDSWQCLIVIAISILRSVKPLGFMIVMLLWCHQLERNYEATETNIKEVLFTRRVLETTAMNISCWGPIAFIRGYVLISEVIKHVAEPQVVYVQWALWFHYSSALATCVTLLVVDKLIRTEAKKLFFVQDKEAETAKIE